MKIYSVELLFEHTATIFVKASSPEAAQKLAEQEQFSTDHDRVFGSLDGNFDGLLSSSYPEEISLKEFEDIKPHLR